MGSKKKSKSKNEMSDDPRFASVHTDPRFQRVPKRESKVTIDSRFNRMFTDKHFGTSSAPVDKRGRPKRQKTDSSLRHYYRIEEEDTKDAKKKRKDEVLSSEEEEEEEGLKKRKRKEEVLSSEEEDEEEESGGDELEDLETESDDDVGGSEEEETSSSSSSSSDEEEENMENVEVENVPVIEEGTRRLAVVNMDWRHVRAVDLFVVLRSFLPKGGQILSVSVYPSEFGLQRMKEEEVRGPVGLFDDENEKSDEDDDDNDEIDYDKLRAYEKSRLRYYYAVVECDSVATADCLYKSCDGVEFERSSNVLDLRFIPDSMDFKHPPRDVATEAPLGYEGLDFHTKALQHSNIPVSWDEDEPQRVKTLKQKFNADQLAELELKEFLASDESETDNDEADNGMEDESDKKHKKRDKYRALIQSGDGSDEDQEEGQDMEVTFNTGLEDLSKRILEKKDKKSETVWEAYLRKRREKKKARKNQSKYSSEEDNSDTDEEGMEGIEQPDDFFIEEPSVKKVNNKDYQGKKNKEEKQLQDTDREAEASKAELELLLADDKGGKKGLKGYNLKPKKAKGKKGKEVPDEDKIPTSNLDDPRFSALFTSPLFALDPTDPQFKRSAVYARQLTLKPQKSGEQQLVEGENEKQAEKAQLLSDDPAMDRNEYMISDGLPERKEKHELSTLVRSIKMKSKQVQLSSNTKDKKLQPKGLKETEKTELPTLVQSAKKAKVLKK
ncbi:pre-rRNA-processing protein esf1 [Populus nigra]|uniref:pre-rRNA-processing protein esf1 n=1 Tax=Populus nigra TaxID=3691 RepID=UPI002B26824B|nr:pre-rRNA-processing protein esf1 [Populus nigra]